MTLTTKFLLDTGVLIGLIEQNRCIWDTCDPDYKNRDVRRNAFEGIASIMISGYDAMTTSMKSEAVKLIQQRWKTARDAYRRDRVKDKFGKCSSRAGRNTKKYLFHENLTFLDNVMHWYESDGNNAEAEEMSENSDCDNNSQIIIKEEHGPSSPKIAKRNKRDVTINEDAGDAHLIEVFQKTQQEDENGDRAFLDSLLPTLRTFDEYERLQFRAEVLRVMMEIKNVPAHVRKEVPETKGHFMFHDSNQY